jgi:hypothetical protein
MRLVVSFAAQRWYFDRRLLFDGLEEPPVGNKSEDCKHAHKLAAAD